MSALPEVWLRGPVPDIPPTLQPVAHALLQAREEVERIMFDFPAERLWERPGGAASVAFHLQHLAGVLDRLFTYARGAALDPDQRSRLEAEGRPADLSPQELVAAFARQVDAALEELKSLDERILFEPRSVGRAALPSTVLGLLFHAAEHAQRHVGQLLVTVRVVRHT